MDTNQRRRMLLARERRWLNHFTPKPSEVRATDLIRGEAYAMLTYHSEACWLLAGGRCSCRPCTKFYATTNTTTSRPH
jgi:hypothetical protein